MNVLLLLGTLLGTAGLVLASVISIATGSKRMSALFGALAMAWVLAYGTALTTTSGRSHEALLPPGETKYFCGFYLDCHIGVAVLADSTARAIGDRTADGTFHIVTLQFSSSAVRATLRPWSPMFEMVGPDGARYSRDVATERTLLGGQPDLERDIPPGGSFTATVVFDVPSSWTAPKLYANQRLGRVGRIVEGLLIGDEDAFGHRKVMQALPTAAHSVGQEVSAR